MIVGQQIHERHDHSEFGALDIVELIFIFFMVVEHLATMVMMKGAFVNFWSLGDLVALIFIIALYIADVIVENFYASAVVKI